MTEHLTCQSCFDVSEEVGILVCLHRICPRCHKEKETKRCPVSELCKGYYALDGRAPEILLKEKRYELELADEKLAEIELDYIDKLDVVRPMRDEIEIIEAIKKPYPKIPLKHYVIGRHPRLDTIFPDSKRFLINVNALKTILVVTTSALHLAKVGSFGMLISLKSHEFREEITAEQVARAQFLGDRLYYGEGIYNGHLRIPNHNIEYRVKLSSIRPGGPSLLHKKHSLGPDSSYIGESPYKALNIYEIRKLELPFYYLKSNTENDTVIVADGLIVRSSHRGWISDNTKRRRIANITRKINRVTERINAAMLVDQEHLLAKRKRIESKIDALERFISFHSELTGPALEKLLAVQVSTEHSSFSSLVINRPYYETEEDELISSKIGKPDYSSFWIVQYGSSREKERHICIPICVDKGIGYAMVYCSRGFLQMYDPKTFKVSPSTLGSAAHNRVPWGVDETPFTRYVCGVDEIGPIWCKGGDEPPAGSRFRLDDDALYVDERPIFLESGNCRFAAFAPERSWFSIDFDASEVIIYNISTKDGTWTVKNRISF